MIRGDCMRTVVGFTASVVSAWSPSIAVREHVAVVVGGLSGRAHHAIELADVTDAVVDLD